MMFTGRGLLAMLAIVGLLAPLSAIAQPFTTSYPVCSEDPNTPGSDQYCDCWDDPNMRGIQNEPLPKSWVLNPNGTGETCDPCANSAWGTVECPICPTIEDPNMPGTFLECSWVRFCGTVQESTQGMTNHGVVLEAPYVGQMFFIGREPDTDTGVGTTATEWDCTDPNVLIGVPGSYCGEFRVKLQDFAPPLSDFDPVDLHGNIEGVDQTSSSWHMSATLDDTVRGPFPPLAINGIANITILCTGCGNVNDKQTIEPDYEDLIGNISGEVILNLTIPRVGGSLAPPEGNDQDVRLDVTQLGGACNNILPATSSWGLVGLVGLMVVTSVFFAGSRFSEDS